ncbi:PQQ-dependent sugar dehydrogenase [Roseivirga misakiensis]|uniref:Glucose/Sorbosone dehydrogenase domain-containing protein n=1 Tax=Roseivirga misakiensis TaxID=1563681 RepID=A0A1E5SY60_9BACT|nr:PQQ-dependent sugar dehydrogenase [Roseivirga misakiensis]OEK03977.1 hypothetical protein BFP71_10790 [Roseivirga misakiensis]
MKRHLLFTFFLFIISSSIKGQSEQEAVRAVLDNFIEGTSYNYPDKILSAFYPGTPMFLHNDADTVMIYSAERYASLYTRRPPGTRNKRYGKILTIDIEKDIASAKIETLIPSFDKRFIDLVLLKKIDGEWKIISKAATAEPIPKTILQSTPKPVKKTVMSGLKKPWSMAFINESEALVAEKDGTVLRVNLETKSQKAISGLPKDVGREILIDTVKHTNGIFPAGAHGKKFSFNAGWFQVLLDPDFQNNQYIYISYAAENEEKASALKVIRGQLNENQLTAVETLFLAGPYTHGLYHYGGGMAFGNDGKLYISTGERNFYEHLNPKIPVAQNIEDPRGKIIRINPDGSIPTDNPNFGKKAVPGLFATGIRAAQGITLDANSGKLWFSEHGTMQGDELNIISPQANYGWPNRTTGGYRTKNYKPYEISGTTYTMPKHFWQHTIAPTGLTFYYGNEFPQWKNNLIVPGLSKGNLWRMVIENDELVSTEELFINDRVRLRKAVTSPAGELYLLTDEADGKIIKLENGNK